MGFDPEEYNLIIRKEKIEGEYFYIGRVAELPNVRAYEDGEGKSTPIPSAEQFL